MNDYMTLEQTLKYVFSVLDDLTEQYDRCKNDEDKRILNAHYRGCINMLDIIVPKMSGGFVECVNGRHKLVGVTNKKLF